VLIGTQFDPQGCLFIDVIVWKWRHTVSATYLLNVTGFYLRRSRRLKRAGLDPLDERVEAGIWAYTRRAADRLERLRDRAGRPSEPVPVKDRRDELPNAL
jgi:hypothetical protein